MNRKAFAAGFLALTLLAGCAAKPAQQTANTPVPPAPIETPQVPPDASQSAPQTPQDSSQGDAQTPPDGQTPPLPVPGAGDRPHEDERVTAVRAAAKAAGCPIAVASAGFAADVLAENFSAEDVYGAFPQFDGATYVDAGGENVFILVPAEQDATVTITGAALTDAGTLEKTEETYYNGTGLPVILRCNVSDIIPNVIVTVTGGAGETYSASPTISLRDGSTYMEGAYDFTEYPEGFEREE